MSKRGYNEKELFKTIVTQIDKDGFNKRTVLYGDDANVGSGDYKKATVTFMCKENDSYSCAPGISTVDGVISASSIATAARVIDVSYESPATIDVPLGENGVEFDVVFVSVGAGASSEVTGDIEITREQTTVGGNDLLVVLTVTGDGTVTINKQPQ